MTDDAWSSVQQAQLDAGLSGVRVGDCLSQRDRWQRISDMVEGKSLKQCVARYREIRESIAVEQYLEQRPKPAAPPGPPITTSKQPKTKTNVRKDWGNFKAGGRDWGNPSAESGGKKEEKAEKNALAVQQQQFEEERKKKKPHQPKFDPKTGDLIKDTGSASEDTGIDVSDGLTVIDDDLVPSRSVAEPYKPQPKLQAKAQLKVIKPKGGGNLPKQKKGWWRRLELDDPISLEPLNELDYPPFRLKLKGGSVGGKDEHLFDGQVLAYFLVSTANFIDPLSREPLDRDDCRKLDDYLKQHGENRAADLCQ
jgi:hypothetical protein